MEGNKGSRPDDPFSFKPEKKKLVLRSKKPWSKAIENIFMETMINPPQYRETIEAAKETAKPPESIHRMNLGIFTYGEPTYQLIKVLELLKQHPDFPVSQIWLTKVTKGDFVTKLVKTKATRKTQLQYLPHELEEDSWESPSFGSGYPLGELPHVLVMFDDNPEELSSILSSNQILKEKTGASFIVVRSRRTKTKKEHQEWEVATPYGEIDFRSKSFSQKEISAILQINRFLSLKNQLGSEHPKVKAAAERLERLGVKTQNLESKTNKKPPLFGGSKHP